MRRWSTSVLLGPRSTRRLTWAHALDDVADGMINVSTVGSLFFSVSFAASRERVLLYLVLTAAPLALVAPIVGPVLDRTRLGQRTLLAGTQIVRTGLSVALVWSLVSLRFYPLLFGVLLSRKAYALARTSLLVQITEDDADLVSASGHLARVGTVAGFLGTGVAGVLYSLFGARVLPAVAAVGFAAAAVITSTVRVAGPRASGVETPVAVATVPGDVRAATVAVSTLRGAAGALTFLLALAIKRGGGDAWVFTTALIASGVGGFLGTMLAAPAHRRFSADRVLVLCLLGPGLVALSGSVSVGNSGIVAIATAIGIGGSVASRAMDGLYSRVPDDVLAQAVSHSELRFQLANVAGASLAVLLTPGPRLGFAVVGGALVAVASFYASQQRLSLRQVTGRLISGDRLLIGELALETDLLDEAEYALSRSRPGVAVVLAASALRIAEAHRPGWEAIDVNEIIEEVLSDPSASDAERARLLIERARSL